MKKIDTIFSYITISSFLFIFYCFNFFNALDFFAEFNTPFLFVLLIVMFLSLLFGLFYYCIKNDNKELMKKFFIVSVVMFSTVFVLGNIGVLPEYYERHQRVGLDIMIYLNNIKPALLFQGSLDYDIVRGDLGFLYPTVGAIAYMSLVLSFIYVYKDKLTTKHHIMLFFLTLNIYIYTVGRALIFLLLGHLIFIFAKQAKIVIDYLNYYLCLIIPIGVVTSVVFGLVFGDNELMKKITSRRSSIWKDYLTEMPIKFINFNPNMEKFVADSLDNFYLFPIFIAGILPAILVFVAFTLVLKYFIKIKDYTLIFIFLTFCMYGFVESVFTMSTCFLILFIPKGVISFIEDIKNRTSKLS